MLATREEIAEWSGFKLLTTHIQVVLSSTRGKKVSFEEFKDATHEEIEKFVEDLEYEIDMRLPVRS